MIVTISENLEVLHLKISLNLIFWEWYRVVHKEESKLFALKWKIEPYEVLDFFQADKGIRDVLQLDEIFDAKPVIIDFKLIKLIS